MVNTYDIGERVKITATFKQNNENGDPAVVRFIYKNPDDVVTTVTYPDPKITKVSTGVYSLELELNASGFWYYRVDDGGTNIAVENFIQVRYSDLV